VDSMPDRSIGTTTRASIRFGFDFRRKCTRVRVRRVESSVYLFFFIDAGEGRDEGVVYDALVWFFNTHSSDGARL
jgi:hypothetical protein